MVAKKLKEPLFWERFSLILRPFGKEDLRMADGEDGRRAGGKKEDNYGCKQVLR